MSGSIWNILWCSGAGKKHDEETTDEIFFFLFLRIECQGNVVCFQFVQTAAPQINWRKNQFFEKIETGSVEGANYHFEMRI